MNENELQSQGAASALLDGIRECAEMAKRAPDAESAADYAHAARSLAEALAAYGQWNRPAR